MTPRTLVTGASGFLGTVLARRLAGEGRSLLLLARAGHEARAAALADALGAEARAVRWDDAADVEHALGAERFADVFHLAGGRVASEGPAAADAEASANVTPLRALLAALAGRPPDAFVLVSSGEVYGDAQPAPFVEQGPIAPRSAYGRAKREAERLGAEALAHGVPVTVARPAVVYGPDQSPVMFVPQLVRALVRGEAFDMSAGAQVRDLVFVDDVAQALCAIAALRDAGATFNIGSGAGLTLAELATRIHAAAGGGEVRRGARPYREGEVMDYRLSIERLTHRTAWRPTTPLEAGLARTVEAARAGDARPDPTAHTGTRPCTAP